MRIMLRISLVFCVFFVAAHAFAQNSSITGAVRDSQGAVIPGAEVRIVEQVQGTTRTVHTSGSGAYSAPYLNPGTYRVYVQAPNFSTAVSGPIVLTVGQTLVFDVHLAIGGAHEEVNVEGGVESVNHTDAALGKPFNNLQIETLPYLANNTLSLLALQPGVVSFDASNTLDPRAGVINGARQDQSNVLLDGVDNNEANYDYAFTGVLRATRDSLEEFRVTTSGADADAGRGSGAQVALDTKSGTNQIHGTAYYYYRDPAAASNNWFYKQSELNSGKPNISAKVLQDTYGATLGLPIVRNKLFFFGAYEGYKQATNSVVTSVVPLGSGNSTDMGVAPGLRNGTITYLNTGNTYTTLTSAQIAAMDTGCSAAGGCPNGPGINAAVLGYLAQYPQSNGTSVGDGHNTGGYTFTSSAPVSNITNIVRLDYNLSPKQTLFVRGNLQSDNTATASQFPGQPPSSNIYGNDRGIAVGHVWSISDKLTNNARYGWTRFGNALIGGVTNNYNQFGANQVTVTLLAPTTTSTVLLENTNNFADDLSWVKGKHTIQVGINDRLIYNNRFLSTFKYSSGSVSTFGLALGGIANTGSNLDASAPATGYPKIASSFNTQYDQITSAVTGLITNAGEYVNYSVSPTGLTPLPVGTLPTHQYKNLEQEYYVQDQFRITPKLTLTAGLRYSYLGVPYEINGQQVRLTTSPRTFLNTRAADAAMGVSYNPLLGFAGGGKVNHAPGFWTAQKLNFAPRIAFNYSPDRKTSIRGGFMLAYDHFAQAVVNFQNDYGSYGLESSLVSPHNLNVNSAPRYTGENSVPTSIIPTPPSGSIAFPYTSAGGSGSASEAIDDQIVTPYAEVFNLSLQREVHHGLTVTATYTGRLGRHLIVPEDVAEPVNLEDPASGQTWYVAAQQLDKAKLAGQPITSIANIPYFQDIFPNATYTTGGVTYHGTQAVYGQLSAGGDATTLFNLDTNASNSPGGQTYRFYHPQFASLLTDSSIGVSSYNALQLSLRHTINKNFIYDFNYTLSHSLDETSNPARGNSTVLEAYGSSALSVITNSFNPSLQYANSDFDVRHAITADWTLALPYGHGQRFGAGAATWLDQVFGGWSLAGIAKWTSALPWSAISSAGASTNYNYRGFEVETAPVQNTGHHTYLKSSTGVLTASAFTNGATGAFPSFRPAYAGEVGQRNNLRADGYLSIDPGISKSFHIFEKQSLRLTVEAFNVTNATRFAVPALANTGRSGVTGFGTYSALLNSPRQMQFSGRYYF
jgi:hypothetical protein